MEEFMPEVTACHGCAVQFGSNAVIDVSNACVITSSRLFSAKGEKSNRKYQMLLLIAKKCNIFMFILFYGNSN
jgi:hypothetical protein